MTNTENSLLFRESYRKKVKIYVISILLGIILSLGTNTILYFLGGSFSHVHQDMGKLSVVIILLLLAPVVETFIFQYLILKIPFKFINVNKYSITFFVLVSAFIFSLQHNYNLMYMISSFIMGLYFACIFVYVEYLNKGITGGFKLVSSIHFSINAIAAIPILMN